MSAKQQKQDIQRRVDNLPATEVDRLLETQLNFLPDEQKTLFPTQESKKAALVEFLSSTRASVAMLETIAPADVTPETGEEVDDFDLPQGEYSELAADVIKGDKLKADRVKAAIAQSAQANAMLQQLQSGFHQQRDPDDDEDDARENADDDSDDPLGLNKN